jgi:hypothetical protein
VYLAADNEEVKEAFARKLEEKHEVAHHEIRVMRVKTKGIIHVKNLAKMKEMTLGEGLLDMVFDWYALSLTNVVLAWRKGGTGIVSTFCQSAARVSGTIKRSLAHRGLGKGGVGTFGLQLQRNKHGAYHWNPFWIYGFLEDYQKPGDNERRLGSRVSASGYGQHGWDDSAAVKGLKQQQQGPGGNYNPPGGDNTPQHQQLLRLMSHGYRAGEHPQQLPHQYSLE